MKDKVPIIALMFFIWKKGDKEWKGCDFSESNRTANCISDIGLITIS